MTEHEPIEQPEDRMPSREAVRASGKLTVDVVVTGRPRLVGPSREVRDA